LASQKATIDKNRHLWGVFVLLLFAAGFVRVRGAAVAAGSAATK
jgi:hypothetical protein